MRNLALNKPALQSSTSTWSRSRFPEQDARGANNGIISREEGFHTAHERNPWWQVDLQEEFLVKKFSIHNRRHCAERLTYFSILSSLDGIHWSIVFTKRDPLVFGKHDDLPYTVDLPQGRLARFVRLRLNGYACLHFSEFQVFGERLLPDQKKEAVEVENRAVREQQKIPLGRIGQILDIGGFWVFADTANYGNAILSVLKSGIYESGERKLVQKLLSPQDRVIEAGTAIGVVSMTIASIVGAPNLVTFEANPDIVIDAQENFLRNGFGGIKSHVGILKNRHSFVKGEEADFHVAKSFWASRLHRVDHRKDIVKTVKVPTFCLEDEITQHSASAFMCDIEGGEVDLLTGAELGGIRTIIIETHSWAAGKEPTDKMVRSLITKGFSINLNFSAQQILVFQR